MVFYEILPYYLWIVALFFIGQALLVFIRKRPLIINSIWTRAVFIFFFLHMVYSFLGIHLINPSFAEILSSLLVAGAVIWLMFLLSRSGYTILGADDADFQKSFHECLNVNNYDFEQSLSAVKIKKPEFEMHVAIQPWIGTVQLTAKRKTNQYVLKDLMSDLSQKKIKVNYISPIMFVVAGGLFLLLAIN